jgi:hypothetical protein
LPVATITNSTNTGFRNPEAGEPRLPAWALWLVVHLFYLIGFQNRLLVVLRWTISFLTRGRGARLIIPTQAEPLPTATERRHAA